MQWQPETVLITGATGFVGGNLAARLVAMGANVISIERDYRPLNTLSALRVRDLVTTVKGDVTDLSLMQRVFAEYNVTYVFHFAAQALMSTAIRDPVSTFETNIKGTWVTLEAARVTPTLKGFVVASSDKAYGDQRRLPYGESLPLLDRYPYGASKVCVDTLAQCYHVTYGLPVAIARSSNIYGPGDLNFSRLVPGAIGCGLTNETLKLRSNGEIRRDYLYVHDAIDGYAALAEGLGQGAHAGETFNFGAGSAHSVLDLCQLIAKLTGSSGNLEVASGAGSEAPEQYLDIQKAREQLSWRPRTSFERGLTQTIAWYREFLEFGNEHATAGDRDRHFASSLGTKH